MPRPGVRPRDPGFEPGLDDVVTQLYTSGTTGLPKGAMIRVGTLVHPDRGGTGLPHRGRHRLAGGHAAVPHRWHRVGPVRHGHGGHSVILRDLDPVVLLRTHRGAPDHRDLRGARGAHVPAGHAGAGHHRRQLTPHGCSTVPRRSGEDVLVRSMRALGCSFAQVYGLTETTGAITSLMPEDHDPDGPRPHSCARPDVRSTTWAADRRHRFRRGTFRPGEVGELWTRSDQNMLGYWNKPDETAEDLISMTGGSTPATPDGSTTRATSSSTTGSRT